MLTCALPDFDSRDLVSLQNPAKFWTLFSICIIAALLLLCSLVLQLHTLVCFFLAVMQQWTFHSCHSPLWCALPFNPMAQAMCKMPRRRKKIASWYFNATSPCYKWWWWRELLIVIVRWVGIFGVSERRRWCLKPLPRFFYGFNKHFNGCKSSLPLWTLSAASVEEVH